MESLQSIYGGPAAKPYTRGAKTCNGSMRYCNNQRSDSTMSENSHATPSLLQESRRLPKYAEDSRYLQTPSLIGGNSTVCRRGGPKKSVFHLLRRNLMDLSEVLDAVESCTVITVVIFAEVVVSGGNAVISGYRRGGDRRLWSGP